MKHQGSHNFNTISLQVLKRKKQKFSKKPSIDRISTELDNKEDYKIENQKKNIRR